jgi:hypothetical protein
VVGVLILSESTDRHVGDSSIHRWAIFVAAKATRVMSSLVLAALWGLERWGGSLAPLYDQTLNEQYLTN